MKNIFVSSTFRDMQAERDLVKRDVQPLLSSVARNYGEYVNMIDLRWGVDTTELETKEGARKVLSVCLDEIENSRPYMLIFLGNRYGSTMDAQITRRVLNRKGVELEDYDISITAMEVEYGALANHMEQKAQGILCIRKVDLEQIKAPEIRKCYEVENEEFERKQRLLKERALKCPGLKVLEYTCTWDEQRECFDDFICTDGTPLSKAIVEGYISLFTEEWESYRSMSWWEKQQRGYQELISKKMKMFRGREEFVEQCYAKMISGETTRLVIRGTVGSGKTSLMCKLITELEAQGNPVYYFLAGTSATSETVYQLLEQFVCYLENHLYEKHLPIEEGDEYVEHLINRIENLSSLLDHRIYVAIDALDQLEKNELLAGFSFLINCNHICYFMSATDDFYISPDIILSENLDLVCIPAVTSEMVAKITEGILAASSRNAYKNMIEAIEAKKHSDNPLYISLLVQRLNMMGMRELFYATSEEEIVTLGTQMILSMPDNIEGAILRIFDDTYLELDLSDSKRQAFKTVIGLITASKRGLSEQHLLRICGQNGYQIMSLDISRLVNYLDGFFVVHANGYIDFTHKVFRESLSKKYDIKPYISMLLAELSGADDEDELLKSEGISLAVRLQDIELAERVLLLAGDTREKRLVETVAETIFSDKGNFLIYAMQNSITILDFVLHDWQEISKKYRSESRINIKQKISRAAVDYLCAQQKKEKETLHRLSIAYMNLGEFYDLDCSRLFRSAFYTRKSAAPNPDLDDIDFMIEACLKWRHFLEDEEKIQKIYHTLYHLAKQKFELQPTSENHMYWLTCIQYCSSKFLLTDQVICPPLMDFGVHRRAASELYCAVGFVILREELTKKTSTEIGQSKCLKFYKNGLTIRQQIIDADQVGCDSYMCALQSKREKDEIDKLLKVRFFVDHPILLEIESLYDSQDIANYKPMIKAESAGRGKYAAELKEQYEEWAMKAVEVGDIQNEIICLEKMLSIYCEYADWFDKSERHLMKIKWMELLECCKRIGDVDRMKRNQQNICPFDAYIRQASLRNILDYTQVQWLSKEDITERFSKFQDQWNKLIEEAKRDYGILMEIKCLQVCTGFVEDYSFLYEKELVLPKFTKQALEQMILWCEQLILCYMQSAEDKWSIEKLQNQIESIREFIESRQKM